MVKEAELPTRSRWLKKLSNPPGQEAEFKTFKEAE